MRAKTLEALNKLAKWRTVFAGWQLGTRPKGEPESDALRDHRELSMLLRVEVSALTRVLIDNGYMTEAEWDDHLLTEAVELDAAYQKKFPGMRSTDDGILVFDGERVAEWMDEGNWKP
jgi:hypothetical protein